MIAELVGQTLVAIDFNNDEVLFKTASGEKWLMRHDQNCCENVEIDQISADANLVIGSPLLVAEEVCDSEAITELDKGSESFTYTYYKFVTEKGEYAIRWRGESNGYYGETPSFTKMQ
jgi:hypothetical protein